MMMETCETTDSATPGGRSPLLPTGGARLYAIPGCRAAAADAAARSTGGEVRPHTPTGKS